MSELPIVLICSAALIVGALLYRRKKDTEWPKMIYQRRPHWPAHQYGENGGNPKRAYVDPAYEFAWAAMCQEVYESVIGGSGYRVNVQGFEVEIQAILRDRPTFDADYRRGAIARWVVNPASPYPAGNRTEADVLRDMHQFSTKARQWVNENANRIKRP